MHCQLPLHDVGFCKNSDTLQIIQRAPTKSANEVSILGVVSIRFASITDVLTQWSTEASRQWEYGRRPLEAFALVVDNLYPFNVISKMLSA